MRRLLDEHEKSTIINFNDYPHIVPQMGLLVPQIPNLHNHLKINQLCQKRPINLPNSPLPNYPCGWNV